jgi:type VI protein secretion system component VasK
VGLWLIGMPAAMVLCYVIRPTLELQGYWVGVTVGMTLTAIMKIILVLSFNWKKWINKNHPVVSYTDHLSANPMQLSTGNNDMSIWFELFQDDDLES